MKHENESKSIELTAVRNLLQVSGEESTYLEKLDSSELTNLKHQILQSVQDGQKEIFGTIAKVSKYMPNFLNAKVSQDILGPQITANLSYFLPPKEAIGIASHFPSRFFADVVEHLVPEKISEMIALTPFPQMRDAVQELVKRGNFFVIGSLIDYTPLPSVDKIARGIADPAHLIQITYFCRDKERVLALFREFGTEKIFEVIRAGLREELFSMMQSIYQYADEMLLTLTENSIREKDPSLLGRYGELIGKRL